MLKNIIAILAFVTIVSCKQNLDPLTIKGEKIDFIKKEVIHTASGKTFDLKSDSLTKIYYLIRHAEKDTQRLDPPLNQLGLARAAKLTSIMRQTFLDAVYTTMTNRTLQTVDSITQYKGVSMSVYTKDNLKEKISELKTNEGYNKVLITGHTNTITPIANFLADSQYFKKIIDEKEYDNFYIVTKYKGGSSKIFELKY